MELVSAAMATKDPGTRRSATVSSTFCATVVAFSVLDLKNTLFNWVTLGMGYFKNLSHEPYSPLHDSKLHICVAALRVDAPGLNTWHEKIMNHQPFQNPLI